MRLGFAKNPPAREFGKYGVLQVRYRKTTQGSSPKRRIVLPVSTGPAVIVAHWLACGHPHKTDESDWAHAWEVGQFRLRQSSLLPHRMAVWSMS